jgi:hypothetical protein
MKNLMRRELIEPGSRSVRLVHIGAPKQDKVGGTMHRVGSTDHPVRFLVGGGCGIGDEDHAVGLAQAATTPGRGAIVRHIDDQIVLLFERLDDTGVKLAAAAIDQPCALR